MSRKPDDFVEYDDDNVEDTYEGHELEDGEPLDPVTQAVRDCPPNLPLYKVIR